VPQPPHLATGEEVKSTIWADMSAGFSYVWGWTGLRALILYSLVLNLVVNPPMELLPLLVTQHFNGQALQLGWLSSAWGFGVLTGGLLLSVWGGFRRRILTMLMGVTGLGVGVLIVGLTPSMFFPLALAGMFFGAVMNSMSNASLFTILQSTITPEMQGRVFALGRSLATAAIPLGMLIAGPLADAVGVQALFWGAGIIYILLGVGAFFIPSLMHLEDKILPQTAPAV
jgi:DHA3 family macrolide efflux protein-like MFS transporter